jgi:hypothetical protein
MKLFVPYTEIQPHTKMVLTGYNYTPLLMEKEDSYINYFLDRWREGESFINCEHDVVFWCGAIESLESCQEEWCAFGTDNGLFFNGALPTLNLMKCSDTFIERFQDVWEDVKGRYLPHGRRQWSGLDRWLNGQVTIVCHQHFPQILNVKYKPIQDSVVIHVG